jgi:hypothetical protein
VLEQLGLAVDVPFAVAVKLVDEDFAAMRALKTVGRVLPANVFMRCASACAVFDLLVSPPLGQEVLSAVVARVAVLRILLAAHGMLITQHRAALPLFTARIELRHECLRTETARVRIRWVLPANTLVFIAKLDSTRFQGSFLRKLGQECSVAVAT